MRWPRRAESPRARAMRWRASILCVIAVGLGSLAPLPASAARKPEELAPPLRRLAARHGLAFGTAVRAAALQQDEDYSDVLGHQYNALTPENELKWAIVHPQADV